MRTELIVVGASAGGLEAIASLLSELPGDFPATVLIAVHLDPSQPSGVAHILDRAGPLRVEQARDGRKLRHARVYVAPPDRHLIVENDRLRVLKGPRENLHRPAIDVLFRTAAFYGRSRVAGVLLTGADGDGTAGLFSIKMQGGVAVVQHPAEAKFPAMPWKAVNHVRIDYVLPLREIPSLLVRLAQSGRNGGRGP